MSPALVVLLYGLTVAVWAPPLLSRLTARGIGLRLGLAAWLVAMASVLVSSVVAVGFLAGPEIAGWSVRARAAGDGAVATCSAVMGRVALVGVALCALVALVVAAALVLMWRYARTLRRAWRTTRAHAEAARIVGRHLPAVDTVVLDAPRPVAYCLPGRPPTIVVTDAALDVLDGPQLSAVLAHERAHLTGRHHLLVALTRGLATVLPGVSLFGRGADEVTRLTEMCADDVAARSAGRRNVVAALLAMETVDVPSRAVLAATGAAVPARVRRLLEPAGRPARVRAQLALVSAMLVIVLSLAAVVAYAVTLTGCATV